MKPQAIAVPVAASVSIECHFWPESGGWKGVCDELSIAVEGISFKDSKEGMERALADYMISIFRERGAKIAA